MVARVGVDTWRGLVASDGVQPPLQGHPARTVVAQPDLRPVHVGVGRLAEAVVEGDHQLRRDVPHTAGHQWRHLATIDDANEYQFIVDRIFPHAYPDVTYLGGRQTAPGEWRWVTGPDSAADGGKGVLFWRGDEQGAIAGGHYANWMSTAFQHGGKWDVSKVCCVSIFSYGVPQFSTSLGTGEPDEHVAGYVVEFGG